MAPAVVRVAPVSGEPALLLSVSVGAADQVDGLLVQPAEPPTLEDPPQSVDEAAARLTRTVRELAELMISISDNTATDHLIGLVGRAAVEQAQRDYGHATPERNEPFLTTRELFVLKLAGRPAAPGAPGPLGAAYLEADEAGRRGLLDGAVAAVPLGDLADGFGAVPVAVDGLEWFASPLDLCRAHVGLHADPEAARILAINPGIPDDAGLWSYIGFKGGSEPGVLGLAWYLEAAGGGDLVVAGTVWEPRHGVPRDRGGAAVGGVARPLRLRP